MGGEASGARPKVLLLGEVELATSALAELEQVAEVLTPQSRDRASFMAECRAGGRLDGVVAAYRTFDSARVTGPVDAELAASLPPSLRFVCHNGAGYDQVDVAACTARGVRVSNTPGAVDDATADMGIFLMLGAVRNVAGGMAALRRGEWRGLSGAPHPALGRDPRGKVLGVLGMGGIGRDMARKAAAAFGMRVRYYNRTRLAPEVEAECGGAELVGFDELLAGSDVLSLNLPLNPKTRHIIGAPEFAKMKRGIVVVNTARGAVMDEAALVAALEDGTVAAAGLDVYEKEPEVHPGLLASDRCVLVPHMGTHTVETQAAMEALALANVVAAVRTGRLLTNVPEQSGLDF
ncbi:glyoxylate reductase [Gaeumannomyces tritici R3-111a-1]|uniref:Glyoxylate reductase n=1 Tax=Gaeumannomyces tritici (strain R3-111a-1) TaxID=644352 RepID=J3P902_GAET3|nr:glyoxylate reductase [Gaeumannomyces tritici R3-111a-1]EJT73137.1 glyoxylate reductase [Gaeumannomyces tritici R3-111a-1]